MKSTNLVAYARQFIAPFRYNHFQYGNGYVNAQNEADHRG